MTPTRTSEVTLPGLLVERVGRDPDRTFCFDMDGRVLTYAQALARSRVWAGAYRRLGVEPGEIVVGMQLNTIDALLNWLGLAWLGATDASINIDYRGALLVHALNLTEARIIVTEARYAERFGDVAGELRFLKTVVTVDSDDVPDIPFEVIGRAQFLDGAEAPADLVLPMPWDICAVLFTSGTTGPSKAVRLPWGQLHASATGIIPVDDLGPSDVIYNGSPTYHIGSKAYPFITAMAGACQFVRPFISITTLGDDFLQYGITVGYPVPTWMAEPERPDDAERPLRFVLVPTTPVPWLQDFNRRFGCRSYGLYTMTELSCPIVDPAWNSSYWDDRGRISCGKVRSGYPGYEARVVDENDQPLGPGVVGELIVRAAVPWTTNAGYLNMPEATAEAWRNGWFHTGDAMLYDEEGRFFFIDRIKDSIRRRSENISSAEVEAVVQAHPAVAEAAAIAVPAHGAFADDEVKVVLVLQPGQVLEPRELIEWLIPRMPRFMIPRYVEIIEEFPKTPTQKIRKIELRAAGITENTWDREAAGVTLPRD